MKRQRILIALVLTFALCVAGASAKLSPYSPTERAPSGEIAPNAKLFEPSSELFEPVLSPVPLNKTLSPPNEVFEPSLGANPMHFGPNIPNEEAPALGDLAPWMLMPGPSSPQFLPAPLPRGVSPVPPPEQPGGPQWGDGKKPAKWMRMLKLFEPGE